MRHVVVNLLEVETGRAGRMLSEPVVRRQPDPPARRPTRLAEPHCPYRRHRSSDQVRLMLKPSRKSPDLASRSPPGAYRSVCAPAVLVSRTWKTWRAVPKLMPSDAPWYGAMT